MSRSDFSRLADIGISGFPQNWLTPQAKAQIAHDAALVTAPNNGVPSWMTQYTSPTLITVLTAKRAAEEIFNPSRFGSYGTQLATFPIVEAVGQVSGYSDAGRGGSSDFNANFPNRDAYYFQTVAQWGDLEQATMSLAKIDAAGQKQISAARTLKIAHNNFWFNGVAGLNCWGILNDPALAAPIASPAGTGGATFATNTTQEIYNKILLLFKTLNAKTGALVDMASPLKLILSNNTVPYLLKATEFNVSVTDMLNKAFPNLTVVTAPQMSTPAGELMTLVVEEVEGQKTADLGYVELMKAHGVVRELSSLKEKYSGATFGAVFYQPMAISSMIGV